MSTAHRPLLRLLEEAFERKAWHGPNLLGSTRGITTPQAAWRPGPGRHNIWEIVVHAAYWKYAVRRRILGQKRGSFPLRGSNWFPRPDEAGGARWESDVQLLKAEHAALMSAVRSLPPSRVLTSPAGRPVDVERLLYGIAAHDVYHAGQIQLIKRLRPRR